jgi:hypothetical protein
MKNLRSILIGLTVLLMASAAQAQQTNVRAKVPFDFVVGNQVYSAGEYSLKSILNSGPIRLDNLQESTSATVMSIPCAAANPSASTKLVFHRMGDEYFLYQIWEEGNVSGRQFPVSPIERRMAQNHENSELVIVAANISK